MAGLADRLEGLAVLHRRGLLSAEEFARAKARVIAEHRPGAQGAETPSGAPPGARPTTPTPAAQNVKPVVPGIGLALGSAAGTSGGFMG